MNENQTRLAAANLLLQRGVRFTIDAPFYKRWLRLNRITIRPLYPGTICELSRIILENGLENATEQQAAENMNAVCKIIAIAVLNDEKKIENQADKLADQLEWSVPTSQLLQIFFHIININRSLDFTNITNYFSGLMNQMMTTRNLGQTNKGR